MNGSGRKAGGFAGPSARQEWLLTNAKQIDALLITGGKSTHDTAKAKAAELALAEPTKPPTNEQSPLGGLPSYSGELMGSNEVRVSNPNGFTVTIGLRSQGKGKNFTVSPNAKNSAFVPDGKYDVYFSYSTDLQGLYQGDAFLLKENGVEIHIVKVVNGNYGIHKVK